MRADFEIALCDFEISAVECPEASSWQRGWLE